jgi:hypothetical protein
VTVAWDNGVPGRGRELLSGRPIDARDGKTSLVLDGEDVAVIER